GARESFLNNPVPGWQNRTSCSERQLLPQLAHDAFARPMLDRTGSSPCKKAISTGISSGQTTAAEQNPSRSQVVLSRHPSRHAVLCMKAAGDPSSRRKLHTKDAPLHALTISSALTSQYLA